MIESPLSTLEGSVEVLAASKQRWVKVPLERKIAYLLQVRAGLAEVAAGWVEVASKAKGLEAGSRYVGEEWLGGIYPVLLAIDALVDTLDHLRRRQDPLRGFRTYTNHSGRTVVNVFPHDRFDRLLYLGYSAEVWMQPDLWLVDLPATVAHAYNGNHQGRVCLVLGAGNVASIPALDVLHRLFVEGQVVVLKMSPINDYLGAHFERMFGALIADGYLRLVYGGADAGEQLVFHEGVDQVHLTGNASTHDAVVFGGGAEGQRRKLQNRPRLDKPVSTELGGVTPTIVIPGPWSDTDFRFHAEHVATQRFQNAGFNCLASQVLVLPADWPQTERFEEGLKQVVSSLPSRPAYYPGVEQRIEVAKQQDESFVELGDDRQPRLVVEANEYCFTNEFFGPVLAVAHLPGRDSWEFLNEAVRFSNQRLAGTLGANLIVHPQTVSEWGEAAFERAVTDLSYGSIGINAWTAMAFALPRCTWGAFPGHHRTDIQSGRGVVHNALMFGKAERSVVRGPFRPIPRGSRPPWFVTHRRAEVVGRRLTRMMLEPSIPRLARVMVAALRP